MTPRTSRAPRGERAYGAAPRNHGKNTMLIAALSTQGIGAADAEAFVADVTDVRVPTLVPGPIVMMDNLSRHKDERVRMLIEKATCRLVSLPAYAPDFTPIAHAFSTVKAFRRRVEARTREGLAAAISAALATITAMDAAGWFTACGYPFKLAQ